MSGPFRQVLEPLLHGLGTQLRDHMYVSHYFEWERHVTGGHAQSVRNQRALLEDHGVDFTTDPDPSADLLHLNNMGPRSVLAAWRARRHGTPVLVHAHQTAEDFADSFALSNLLARPMRPYLERAYSVADHLACPSEHNQSVIGSYTDTPTTVISNGFDPDKLAVHDDQERRERYHDRYDLSPPVVFTVGHVIERKGLAAFVETAREMPEVDFVWFGYLNPTGGRLGRFLQSSDAAALVESAPENCRFTGYVDDIAAAFAAGDVFYFPTRNENEGMALLEAMHCGKPPVVRSIPTYEWLEDGEDCLKADSVEGFVAALERLLDDPDERAAVGATARDRSAEFRLDRVGARLIDLYEDLVDASRGRS